MQTKKRPKKDSYLDVAKTVAPVYAIKNFAGNAPKGAIEHLVEHKVRGSRVPSAALLRAGMSGRGLSRAMAGTVTGIATAPLFLKGVDLLKSNRKRDKVKGTAMIGLSTLALGGSKGMLEGYRRARKLGTPPATALKSGLIRGVSRSVRKVPGALLLSAAIASGQKKSKDTGLGKHVTPLIAGAGLGAVGQSFEDAMTLKAKGLSLRKILPRLKAPALAGAASGSLGAALASATVAAANRALEKKSEAAAGEKAHGTGIPTMKPWFAPYPHQSAAIDQLYDNRGKLILAHGTGTGKAQPLSAPVLTPRGWLSMGSLCVGDRVVDPDGGVGAVEKVHPQGVQDVYRITFSDDSYAECTRDHLWLVGNYRGEGRERILSLGGIIDGHLTAGATGAFIVNRGYKQMPPRADGSRMMDLCIPNTLPVHLDTQTQQFDPFSVGGFLSQAFMQPKPEYTQRRFIPEDRSVFELLEYVLYPNALMEKNIHREYLLGDLQQRTALAQGILSGAGVLGKNRIELATLDVSLAADTVDLFRSLGALVELKENHSRDTHGKFKYPTGQNTQHLYITPVPGFLAFADKGDMEEYTRWYERRTTGSPRTRRIKKIEQVRREECQCISVSTKRRLYITNDFVVTHNTASAIYGVERMVHDGKSTGALVVVPSGLRDNFAKNGVEQFTTSDYQIVGSGDEVRKDPRFVRPDGVQPNKKYTIVSYAMFRRYPRELMRAAGANTLVFDEFHKVRNEQSSIYKAALEARKMATSFIGLTASPVNNSPSEIATLLTISEAKREMSPSQFRRAFLKTVGTEQGFGSGKRRVQSITNEPQLARYLHGKVNYITSDDLKGKTMPRKDAKDVMVPMSKEQWNMYQLALDRLGPIKEYIARRDKDIKLKDPEFLFTAITQARQVANSLHTARKSITPAQSAERTPKTKKLLDDTLEHLGQDPQNKVVLYSNLVNGGVDVLVAGLRNRGIEPAIFVGKGKTIGGTKVTGPSRQQGVQDYKDGKRRVIVLSGAGAEGLDLKNSTAFYSLDGHFNPERIIQAEARARRLGGQSFRAPEKRVVDVRRYQSVAPASARPGMIGRMLGRTAPRTTDEWMYNVAASKHKQTAGLQEVLRSPRKYIRKEMRADGTYRYVYPRKKKPRGLFSRLFGVSSEKDTQPKRHVPAQNYVHTGDKVTITPSRGQF